MSALPADTAASAPAELGLQVLQRGWLSCNQIVFAAAGATPSTVVDTGFCSHAAQTAALITQALQGRPLERIVNTHLHSDHCGGNAALQQAGPVPVPAWVPAASLAAVRAWDVDALSHRLTDQPCPPFAVTGALHPGTTIRLGPTDWQIHAAPGHDMDAILLFEPQTRVLISGDALWEDRLAIVFPELAGDPGFAATRATLDLVDRLRPRLVIPGHGSAFADVGAALASSRARLDGYARQPERHLQHAARALVMFHLLEHRNADFAALVDWMLATPVFRQMIARRALAPPAARPWAAEVLQSLVDTGALRRQGERLAMPADRS